MSSLAPVRQCSLNHVTMFLYNAFAAAMLDSTFLWQGTPVFEKGWLVLHETYVIWSDLNIQLVIITGFNTICNLRQRQQEFNWISNILIRLIYWVQSYDYPKYPFYGLKAFPTFFVPKNRNPDLPRVLAFPKTCGKSGFYCTSFLIKASRPKLLYLKNFIKLGARFSKSYNFRLEA